MSRINQRITFKKVQVKKKVLVLQIALNMEICSSVHITIGNIYIVAAHYNEISLFHLYL